MCGESQHCSHLHSSQSPASQRLCKSNNASICLSSLLEEKNVLVGSDIGAKHFSYACMIRSGSCWQHKMCKILPRSTRNSLCAHLMLAVQDLTDVGIDPLLFCLRKQLAALVSDLAISVTVSHRKMSGAAQASHLCSLQSYGYSLCMRVTVGHLRVSDVTLCSTCCGCSSHPRKSLRAHVPLHHPLSSSKEYIGCTDCALQDACAALFEKAAPGSFYARATNVRMHLSLP